MTITIDEAIKTSEANELVYRLAGDTLGADATKLGIEALEQLRDWRRGGIVGLDEPLPSETK